MTSTTSSIIIALYLAAIPVAFWVWMFFRSKKSDFESPRLWIKLFFGGILSTIPAAFIEFVYSDIVLSDVGKLCLQGACDITQKGNLSILLFSLFIIVAPAEELLKYLFLKQTIWGHPKFTTVADGIKFGVVVALGFAAFENFLYFVEIIREGEVTRLASTFLIRLFLSTLAHTVYTGIVGYYIAKARFYVGNTKFTIFKGLLIAIIIHGLFNFFLFSNLGIYALLIIVVTLVSLILAANDIKNRSSIAQNIDTVGDTKQAKLVTSNQNIEELLESQRAKRNQDVIKEIYQGERLKKLKNKQ